MDDNSPKYYKNSIPLPYDTFYKNTKYNEIRRLKLVIMSDILGAYPFFQQYTYFEKIDIIRDLENGCLDEAIKAANENGIIKNWKNVDFVNLYHSICFNILSNLDYDTRSESLIQKIEAKEVNMRDLAKMTSMELCPEKHIIINKKIEQRNNFKRKLKYSELYQCRKCKNKKCTIEKRFNRSLDEGVNLTINCIECGFSWNS